jgi:drug/metabolite transporter (DMT)-like permease
MIPDTSKKIGLAIGFGLLAAVIWGSWPVVSKSLTMQNLTFWDITAIRFSAAGVILLPILLIKVRKLDRWLLKGLILSIGAGAPYVLVATFGLTMAPSSHFGIIAPSCMLLFTTIGSVLFFKEKVNKSRIFGIALILSGVVSVSASQIGALSSTILTGDLLFILSGLLWASYTMYCRYWQINPWLATALVAVFSMMLYMPYYFYNHLDSLANIPVDVLLQQGVYQGVVISILALFLYSKSVSILGASKGAIFAALVPPTTMLLSVLLLGETIGWVEQLGLLSVSIGFVFALGLVKKIPMLKLR